MGRLRLLEMTHVECNYSTHYILHKTARLCEHYVYQIKSRVYSVCTLYTHFDMVETAVSTKAQEPPYFIHC